MARYVFRLPDVGEGIAEAEIVVWHVRPGDELGEDQPLLDVMTDKATVEMPRPCAAAWSRCMATLDRRCRSALRLWNSRSQERPGRRLPPVADAPERPARPLAAPATRRRAQELGIDLASVHGTGPEGRVTPEDLQSFTQVSTEREPRRRTGVSEVRITGLRRRIAERMEQALHIPHFGYVEEFDLTELEMLRGELNRSRSEDQPKLTPLPFFIQAISLMVRRFPQMNAHYDDRAAILRTHEAVHIGVATQTSAGLRVPVVRHAEALGIWERARQLRRVTEAARDGSAAREDLTGSTITLTSLGALGGISATPVINPPEVAIIGPNKLVERPVVVNGHVAVRRMMNVSSAFDHRIVDGFEAAQFVQGLKRLLEHPALLFMES